MSREPSEEVKLSHTPGPWEIEPKERREHPLFVMDSNGDRIARCDGLNMADFGPDPQHAKANARLIAAAPDLLAALKLLYAETADYIRVNNLGDVHHNQSMQLASAAIVKAETGKP